MAGMLSSARNRGTQHVDDPWDGDGFYRHRRFHGNRKAGAATGKRGWRRALRNKEKNAFQRALRHNEV